MMRRAWGTCRELSQGGKGTTSGKSVSSMTSGSLVQRFSLDVPICQLRSMVAWIAAKWTQALRSCSRRPLSALYHPPWPSFTSSTAWCTSMPWWCCSSAMGLIGVTPSSFLAAPFTGWPSAPYRGMPSNVKRLSSSPAPPCLPGNRESATLRSPPATLTIWDVGDCREGASPHRGAAGCSQPGPGAAGWARPAREPHHPARRARSGRFDERKLA
mmetsp:Transcript_59165/g.152181  ORF Transcript_59165/g.152181 Transcript_59165/m.152181 type:complete len:214 (+) Transcript_59165:1939-2580(+)